MKNPTITIIGAGQRGKDVYASYLKEHHPGISIVAVAESDEIKRAEMAREFQIRPENVFSCYQRLLEGPRLSDAVIIATPDDQHFVPAQLALEKGYHVLLEKPMSNKLSECLKLAELARGRNQVFLIGHVLRYTPFFTALKQLLQRKAIGELITIQHNENIGYYHFAHSFVRGVWKSAADSSPLILAKSCHDLDILLWLVGKNCLKLSSYGQLSHFRPEAAPPQAGERCLECPVESDCPYSAKKIYYPRIGKWPTTVVCSEQTEQALTAALYQNDYGRCVYKSNNDVVDHQVTILEFEDKVTATFNLSAFTSDISRTMKLMGSKGEIRAHLGLNEIEVITFGSSSKQIIRPDLRAGGHGGGDTGLTEDFISLIKGEAGQALTSAEESVQSHLLAFATEESRLTSKSIDVKQYRQAMIKGL